MAGRAKSAQSVVSEHVDIGLTKPGELVIKVQSAGVLDSPDRLFQRGFVGRTIVCDLLQSAREKRFDLRPFVLFEHRNV